jgi:ATP-dependent DNA helicase RecG
MNEEQLKTKLEELLALYNETEVVEFKEANNSFDFKKLCKYFSALSNEANLKNANSAWLVFGINLQQKIIGTNFRPDKKDLHSLKGEIAKQCQNHTFIEIYEITIDELRVIMFQIPPAPQGIPIGYQDHYYARNGEEITGLSMYKLEQIRNQNISNHNFDWSAQICEDAELEDLDINAIAKAKSQAIDKATGLKKIEFENSTSDIDFLDKAKITKNGKITYAALILLGKEIHARNKINPSGGLELVWIDYLTGTKRYGQVPQIYPPFVLTVDDIATKIRISKHDYMVKIGGLNTTDRRFVDQYEVKSIREALHNCIAHQDYTQNARVFLEEHADRLVFKNFGYSVITDGESLLNLQDKFTPHKYRNRFLAEAMDTINMMERFGSGQRSIYQYARNVFLPLPDRFSDIENNKFDYVIYGSKIDETFATILQDKQDLDIGNVILLDRVQKYDKQVTDKQISKDQAKALKKLKLVEGRYPNIYLSHEIARVTDSIINYEKNTNYNDFRNVFENMIIEVLKTRKTGMTKSEMIDYVHHHLPYTLQFDQTKLDKDISNSMTKLKINQKIITIGNNRSTKYLRFR